MQLEQGLAKLIRSCSSASELITKAAEADVELTQGQAEKLMEISENDDLDLDELDSVAGGAGNSGWSFRIHRCPAKGCGGIMLLDHSQTPTGLKCYDCGLQTPYSIGEEH